MSDKLQAERDRFEREFLRANRKFDNRIGEYIDDRAQAMWAAWQSALSSSQQVREETLEQAAKICDGVNNHDNPMTAGDCADAIRSLKSTPASPSQPSSVAMTDAEARLRLEEYLLEIFDAKAEMQKFGVPHHDFPTMFKSFCTLLQSSPKGASTGTEREADTIKSDLMTANMYGVCHPQDWTHRAVAEIWRLERKVASLSSTQEASKSQDDHKECCDTPRYCSSVRRCTAKDEAASQPSAASGRELPRALEFANHVINGVFDGGDWDGGDLQNLAIDYGLLKPAEMKERCGENCACAENDAAFPAICYRKTYAIAALTSAAPADANVGEDRKFSNALLFHMGLQGMSLTKEQCKDIAAFCDNFPTAPEPSAPADKELLDWLDQNLFNREPDGFDRMSVGKDRTMWVFFAPIRHGGGTARKRIAEAMQAMRSEDGKGGEL